MYLERKFTLVIITGLVALRTFSKNETVSNGYWSTFLNVFKYLLTRLYLSVAIARYQFRGNYKCLLTLSTNL